MLHERERGGGEGERKKKKKRFKNPNLARRLRLGERRIGVTEKFKAACNFVVRAER